MNPYSTHMPVVDWALGHYDVQSVFEFGMGDYSTRLFVDRCDRVQSIEMQNRRWYTKMAKEYGRRAEMAYMGGPDRAIDSLHGKWDMVFVDGDGRSRWKQVKRAFYHTKLIVAHDTEALVYRWDRIVLPLGWIWYDVTEFEPWTAVIVGPGMNLPSIPFANTQVQNLAHKEYTNEHTEPGI